VRSLAREDRPIGLLMTTPRVGEGSLEIVQVTHERRIRSFAIITTTPNELCAELHNRMPAVLKPDAWRAWLGEQPATVRDLKAVLAPYPSAEMICWPVSTRVGNVKNNDPSLIEPISLPLSAPSSPPRCRDGSDRS